jgi:hypothetical protein
MYSALLCLCSLGMWSRAIEGFSESRVSVRRVRDFLLLPEAPKRNWGSTAAASTTASTTADSTTAGGSAANTTATDTAAEAATAGGNGVVSNGAVSNGVVNGDSSADHAVQQQPQQPLLSIKDAAFSWHALTEAYAKITAAALAPLPTAAAVVAAAAADTPPQQNGAASEQQQHDQQHEQQHEQQPTVSNVTFDAHRGKLVSYALFVHISVTLWQHCNLC